VLNNLALVLSQSGQPGEAEKLFREALAVNPNFIQAWVNLGALYKQRGNPQEARRSLEKALELCADTLADAETAGQIKRLLEEF
jgi:Flp pilus assembly protein TadD